MLGGGGRSFYIILAMYSQSVISSLTWHYHSEFNLIFESEKTLKSQFIIMNLNVQTEAAVKLCILAVIQMAHREYSKFGCLNCGNRQPCYFMNVDVISSFAIKTFKRV